MEVSHGEKILYEVSFRENGGGGVADVSSFTLCLHCFHIGVRGCCCLMGLNKCGRG